MALNPQALVANSPGFEIGDPVIGSDSARRRERSTRVIRDLGILVVLSCGPVQWLLDDSFANFFCSTVAILTAVATILYTFRVNRFRRAPLSCLMLLGFNVSSMSGALIIQSSGLRAISYNLDSPLRTFTALAATQVLAIAVHYVYMRSRILQAVRAAFTRRVCRPLGLLEPPSNVQLWVFGLIGCLATVLSARNYTDTVKFGDASTKFAVAYVPFAVAPFFIPMRAYLFGQNDKGSRSGSLSLVAYALLLITVAIVNNSRGTFSAGFLTTGLCFLISLLSGNLHLTWRKTLAGLAAVCLIVPMFIGLSDLATAMVIARDERSTVSPTELIEITLSNFQNKALLAERRRRDAVVEGGEYNENYVDNPLFARFVYTKFVDVNLTNALSLSETQAQEVRERSWNRVLAILPTPILTNLHIDVDKSDLGYSSGDIYSYIAHGRELGSYTTGSEVPDGLTIFEGLFWPLLAVMVVVQFVLYDGFSVTDAAHRLNVSPVALINVVPIFTLGVMQESVADQVSAIARGVAQLILLYWVVYVISSLPSKVMGYVKTRKTKLSRAS